MAEWHDALFAPFPHRAHLPHGELDEGAIPEAERAFPALRLDDGRGLAHGKRPRQGLVVPRRTDRLRGVHVHATLALEKGEERAEGRQVPAHRRLRDSLGPQVREIRPDREHVDVPGAERGGGPVPEDSREKGREAGEIRAVRGARGGRAAAFVGQVAVERGDVRGEGGGFYDGFVARLRTSAASALISGSVSFLPKGGISS